MSANFTTVALGFDSITIILGVVAVIVAAWVLELFRAAFR